MCVQDVIISFGFGKVLFLATCQSSHCKCEKSGIHCDPGCKYLSSCNVQNKGVISALEDTEKEEEVDTIMRDVFGISSEDSDSATILVMMNLNSAKSRVEYLYN